MMLASTWKDRTPGSLSLELESEQSGHLAETANDGHDRCGQLG